MEEFTSHELAVEHAHSLVDEKMHVLRNQHRDDPYPSFDQLYSLREESHPNYDEISIHAMAGSILPELRILIIDAPLSSLSFDIEQ
jgi:hypothetical protein